MKTWLSQTRLAAVLGAVISLPTVFGADADQNQGQPGGEPVATPVTVVTEQARPTATTIVAPVSDSPRLPYGVDDVLKLSRARMNDDVTLNYIQNSGTIYNLGAQDLIYLKNQGVSDKVINAMQDQKRRAMEALSQTTTIAAPAVEVYSGTPASPIAPVYAPQQPIYVQEPTYYEPVAVAEPESEPESSVYVIPYPTPTYPRYTVSSSYPSFGWYYGSYGVFGARAPFRGGMGPALHGGPVRGVYHFGGGGGARPAGGHMGGGGHVSGAHVSGGGSHGGGARGGHR